MLVPSLQRVSSRRLPVSPRRARPSSIRFFSNDERNRLSSFWVPTGGITPKDGHSEDTHALLVRAGFLRQAHSGIFHMLPLGLRVQEKFERLIDKHMRSIGASKVSLSSISSEELWRRTGRLEGKELLRLKDRNNSGLLLGPTHEEEITQLVRNTIKSYKQLPLRLYQVSRKYRDELRPRQGLLRAKEFLMKDLYTFDHLESEALETYKQARQAYVNILTDLKIPFLVADADSGAIGGDTSHEYHFISPKGEDTVFACDTCGYTANEEVAQHRDRRLTLDGDEPGPLLVWRGISKDRATLVEAHAMLDPGQADAAEPAARINMHAVKALFPDLDTAIDSSDAALELWNVARRPPSWEAGNLHHHSRLVLADANIHTFRDRIAFEQSVKDTPAVTAAPTTFQYLTWDGSLFSSSPPPPPPPAAEEDEDDMSAVKRLFEPAAPPPPGPSAPRASRYTSLRALAAGARCPAPACAGGGRGGGGRVAAHRAVEVGHTFHLGTRYSAPLGLSTPNPAAAGGRPDAVHMGCHGIGVSRMLAAVADALADGAGLNWPRAVAPFEVVVVPAAAKAMGAGEAEAVYDRLAEGAGVGDVVLDDRGAGVSVGWKLGDADLVGYSVIVVLGRQWKEGRKAEVQCRRLGVKELVVEEKLVEFVGELLGRL